MSNIFSVIDKFLDSCDTKVSRAQMKKINLYCEGLKAKISQCDYALHSLSSYDGISDLTFAATQENPYKISDKVHFYVDSFWTFLYSSLDVLSQIVNQAIALKLNEENTSFKQVLNKLGARQYQNTPIKKAYDRCVKSHHYKNLEKYRHCSTHRKHVYVKEEFSGHMETPGYGQVASTANASPEITSIRRLLCDDPYDPRPRITRNRLVPDYLIETKDKLIISIIEIIKAVEPCK